MFRKIGITATFVGALMFSVGMVNTFAKEPNCPDSCKCPDTIKCDPECVKEKTDKCICKH